MTDKNTKQGRSEPAHRKTATVPISSSEIGTRIAEIADGLGGYSALARMADVSESVVRKWAASASEPTTSNLVAVARAGGVTIEWLATGALPREPGKLMSAERHIEVPLYNVRFTAGHNAFFDAGPADDSILLPRAWPAENAGTTSTRLAFIHMHGDAMKPELNNGDLLLIDRAEETIAHGIYVFFVSGFLFIQRFALKPGDESPLPDPEETAERTGLVGRVVWTGRRL